MVNAIRWVVAGVLIAAAVSKLLNLPRFVVTIRDFNLFPASFVLAIALALPPTELVLGLLLVVGYTTHVVATISAALFMAFAIVLGIKLTQGASGISCGCLGRASQITWVHVWRNLGLMCLALSIPSISVVAAATGVVLLAVGSMPLNRFHLAARV